MRAADLKKRLERLEKAAREGSVHVTLPYPPSTNRYWRHNRGRTHISSEGKAYREAVKATLWNVGGFGPHPRLALHVTAFPPDRRRRDLDNLFKALLDALAHAGLYEDDAQIDELSIKRCARHPGGQLVVRCQQLAGAS